MRDEMSLRLDGWRTTTATILYHMPDHPALLQSFLWQTLDLPPQFPRLRQFLDHWRREIEAVIHSIEVAAEGSMAPGSWRRVDAMLRLH
jgi:uncharacterized protein Usg